MVSVPICPYILDAINRVSIRTTFYNYRPISIFVIIPNKPTHLNALEKIMTETKSTRLVRRGRIFPEIQWSEDKKAEWKAEKIEFKQRCQQIFEKLQPSLIKTHYNWYLAVEPESGEYFINEDAFVVAKIAHEKYPNFRLHVFRINETGVCGTI
jgi:hypothetical protein